MTARLAASIIALAALASLPFWMPGIYYVNVASQILLYAVFALGLNVIVGYGGLVSLGHAGLFGLASYAAAILLAAGAGHAVAIAGALVATLIGAAIYAALSLRATGIGFVMITLALGQILWGLAYRWLSITNGDNGISVASRPAPFGIALDGATAFYYATLVVFGLAVLVVAVVVRSPFGASLKGTRDQPRRMTALGYHVWLIRFYACLFSGLLSGVAGLLFLYYNEFISPHALQLSASAEALLMVISGGSGTLMGPIAGAALVVVMKNVASAYIERWNLVLGAIFVAIVVFMPEGFVPGTVRLVRWGFKSRKPRVAVPVGGEGAMTALAVSGLEKSFGGLRVTAGIDLVVEPGERRLVIGPNGAGKTTLFNLITGELVPDGGSIALFGRELVRMPSHKRAHLGLARTYQIITLFARDTLLHNVMLSLLGVSRARWNPFVALSRQTELALRAEAALARVGLGHLGHRPLAETSYGERRRVEIAMALAQNPRVLLLDEPFAGLSIDERRDVLKLLIAIPREVTIVMIEHDMDVALDFAERITVMHFGEVVVEGSRAEVVADPKVAEIYLGT